MLNIFIIDHRPVLRFGIRYLLDNSVKDFLLHEFNSFQEINLCMDQNLPSPNLIFIGADAELKGTQILPKLRNIFDASRFIIYDIDTKPNEGIKYLRSGAHGYLSNKSDLDSLAYCIKTVMDGKFYIDPRDLHTILEGFVLETTVFGGKRHVRQLPLTPRQNEIAGLFAMGMSTSKIAKKLALSSSTVSTVKSTIYKKLKIDNVVDLKAAMS